jgi:hypothetical protein
MLHPPSINLGKKAVNDDPGRTAEVMIAEVYDGMDVRDAEVSIRMPPLARHGTHQLAPRIIVV